MLGALAWDSYFLKGSTTFGVVFLPFTALISLSPVSRLGARWVDYLLIASPRPVIDAELISADVAVWRSCSHDNVKACGVVSVI